MKNPEKIEQILRNQKKIINLNVSLTLSIPVLIFWLEVLLLSYNPLIDEFYLNRLIFIEFLLILSIFLIFPLSHIRIKKPDDSENLSREYIRIGWLIMKLSHHKKGVRDHEIHLGNRKICAGCFGGVLGLIVGISLGFGYISNFNTGPLELGLTLSIFGFIFIGMSFLKYSLHVYGFKRLIINALLPFGLWMIILGSDIFFKNAQSIFYSLMIIIFLATERLLLAKLDHKLQRMSRKNKKDLTNMH